MARTLLIMGAAAAVLAAGGGSSGDEARRDNRYVDEVNRIQADVGRAVDRIPVVRADAGAGAGLRALRTYGTAVDGVIARLRRVAPPKRLAAGHRRLVAVI